MSKFTKKQIGKFFSSPHFTIIPQSTFLLPLLFLTPDKKLSIYILPHNRKLQQERNWWEYYESIELWWRCGGREGGAAIAASASKWVPPSSPHTSGLGSIPFRCGDNNLRLLLYCLSHQSNNISPFLFHIWGKQKTMGRLLVCKQRRLIESQ